MLVSAGFCACFQKHCQPRSQGLSSYRPIEPARKDPGTCWSRSTLTIENIREGSSVIRQLIALSFAFHVSRCAATDITRDGYSNNSFEISNSIYSNVYLRVKQVYLKAIYHDHLMLLLSYPLYLWKVSLTSTVEVD